MSDADEAQLTYWYDVVEEVVNGRPDGHSCPYCGATPLKVEVTGARFRITCSACGEYLEGRMP